MGKEHKDARGMVTNRDDKTKDFIVATDWPICHPFPSSDTTPDEQISWPPPTVN